MFTLDPRLAADTLPVSRLALCDVLLMDEPAFPWLILVPRRGGVREIIDLSQADRRLLADETAFASEVVAALHAPDKLNVAALGNMVPQLHVHVIARFERDAAWPRPVWGAVERSRHPPGGAAAAAARFAAEIARRVTDA
ncbi:MAG: HIT domain-containing protein [Alphaproteobacteria bacterium]